MVSYERKGMYIIMFLSPLGIDFHFRVGGVKYFDL